MSDHRNAGYRRMFDGPMSYGLFYPITTSEDAIPPLEGQLELGRYAESLGFDALWVRDVPLFSPTFNDAGQVYDPWVFLAQVAAATDDIALATGSIVLPLRHPLHVAKSAASLDRLSNGRLVLGVASGDRPEEYPAFGIDEAGFDDRFRDSVRVLRAVWGEEFPELETQYGTLDGSLELLPKPTRSSIPLLVTGYAGQSLAWIGEHGDGWVYYQRDLDDLRAMVDDWRSHATNDEPFVQVLHLDLRADPDADPEPLRNGYRAGINWIADHVQGMADCGVDHVMINVRHGGRDVHDVLEEFATHVIDG